MRHLRALADLRVLELDEGSRFRSGSERRPGAEVAERADQDVTADLRVDRDDVRSDLRTGGDAGVTAQHGERMDRAVRLELDLGVDPRRLGVDNRDAGEHVLPVHALPQSGRRVGQLDPRVHAFDLVGVGRLHHAHIVAVFDHEAHGVGQIQLALDVLRLQAVERRPQPGGLEHVDRRVDLADRELLLGRIGILPGKSSITTICRRRCPSSTALGAPGRSFAETNRGIELLLGDGVDEGLIALATGRCLVDVHAQTPGICSTGWAGSRRESAGRQPDQQSRPSGKVMRPRVVGCTTVPVEPR